MHQTPITDDLVDEIATESDTDRRTVVRRLAHLPVRGRAGQRIDRALSARGLLAEHEARHP